METKQKSTKKKTTEYKREIPKTLTNRDMIYDIAQALGHIMNVQTEILNRLKPQENGNDIQSK